MNYRFKLTMLCGCVALVLSSATACAAPDDGEQVLGDGVNNVNGLNGRLMVNQRVQFDQWMFQGAVNSPSEARKRIDRSLKLQLAALELKHQLSEDQKKKLELAARGDVKRLFSAIEELRAKFQKVENDNNQLGAMWQQIQPLQRQLTRGPFGPGSLFAKVLSKTLSAEQSAQEEALRRERRAFRYRAAIDVSVSMLEDAVPLRSEQREKVIKLISDKSQPPLAFGQYDYYYVMYQLSQINSKEVKSLLDERQWGQLQPIMMQMRGMRQMLIQNDAMAGNKNEGIQFFVQ
jgi:hypothetical protein